MRKELDVLHEKLTLYRVQDGDRGKPVTDVKPFQPTQKVDKQTDKQVKTPEESKIEQSDGKNDGSEQKLSEGEIKEESKIDYGKDGEGEQSSDDEFSDDGNGQHDESKDNSNDEKSVDNASSEGATSKQTISEENQPPATLESDPEIEADIKKQLRVIKL